MSSFGVRLQMLRKELRLSQEAFGAKIGITKASVSCAEKDKTSLSQKTLCQILLNFNANLNFLLAGKGEMFIKEQPKFDGETKNALTAEIESILKAKGYIL